MDDHFTAGIQLEGKYAEHLKWLESSRHGTQGWQVDGSSARDYSRRARFGGRNGLLDIINTYLDPAMNTEDRVGLDIAAGASAQALLDLINWGNIDRGLAADYDGNREAVKDEKRLSQVKGDLGEKSTWTKIDKWQQKNAPDGFAIVMHRPVGALQDLPTETYKGAANHIIDMLADGGLFFTQIPRSLTTKRPLNELESVCKSILNQRASDRVECVAQSNRPFPLRRKDNKDYFVALKKHA